MYVIGTCFVTLTLLGTQMSSLFYHFTMWATIMFVPGHLFLY